MTKLMKASYVFYTQLYIYHTNTLVKILKMLKPPWAKTLLECQMTKNTLTEPVSIMSRTEPPISRSQLKVDTCTYFHLLSKSQ